jgi:hypothetical protein
MRNNTKPKLVWSGIGVVVLIVGMTLQANGYDDQDSPNCRGASQAEQSAQRSRANQITEPPGNSAADLAVKQSQSKISSSKTHGVKLLWNAGIPASNSPGDAIKGYNIYRRSSGMEYEQLNTDVIRGTSCFDDLVTPGHTYYYVTKSVSASGTISKPSQEVHAVIPPR